MKTFVVAILFVVFAAVLWGVGEGFGFLGRAPGSSNSEVIFEVRPNETFTRVSERLKSQNLVSSSFWLRMIARFLGTDRHLHAGEYALRSDMKPMEILDIFASGKVLEHSITFPEGFNCYDIALEVENKGLGTSEEFLKLIRDPKLIHQLLGEDLPSLEGYLFPETYRYTKYSRYPVLENLVRVMVGKFNEVYAGIGHHPESGFTRHQLVTLASVVEKETGAPDERPLIASVFHNRLSKGIRLQSDPTTLYGLLMETGEMKKNITRADLLHATPYNTYTVNGLPAGPISNPGREALLAALHPAQSRYLFFVSRNDGTHIFSESLEQHNSAVRKFQINPAARRGKSWRDLKQRRAGG